MFYHWKMFRNSDYEFICAYSEFVRVFRAFFARS